MSERLGNWASPANQGAAIVNDVAFAQESRAIYVGVAGDVSAVMSGPDGNTLIFKNAAAGSVLPICATKVTAANTSATNLVAIW